MKLSPRHLRRAGIAAAATAAAILVPVTALAAPAQSTAAQSAAAQSAAAQSAGPQAAVPGCTASQLATWIGLPGDAAAGTTFFQLEFSNISARACSLTGFPGASATGGSGTQLGTPADRNASHPVTRVTLGHGATAHAILGITDVLNFPSASCRPVTASALRVFAPNDFTAHSVPFSFRACQHAGPVFLHVSPVIAGTGIPGFSR